MTPSVPPKVALGPRVERQVQDTLELLDYALESGLRVLGGGATRTATWWHAPQIFTTTPSTKIGCWDESFEAPGAVQIATSGAWDGVEVGLKGAPNHAKIGVMQAGARRYAIFGDLNQQGTLRPPKCERSQNGRGGLFFALENRVLFESLSALVDGDTAPTRPPR